MNEIVYKYELCIFCQHEWHDNTTPIRHLFRECTEVHKEIKIKIAPNDEPDKIYAKWNLVNISKLACHLHKITNKK